MRDGLRIAFESAKHGHAFPAFPAHSRVLRAIGELLMDAVAILPGLLPGVSWLLAVRFAVGSKRVAGWFGASELGMRDACQLASVVCGLWTIMGTELLSAFTGFGVAGVTLLWLVPFLGLIAANWRTAYPFRERATAALGACSRLDLVIGAAAGLLMLGALLQCLFSPPNTPDSVSYHLPRQIYWVQQSSIHHFLTTDLRQIVMPPFFEICGANLLLLSGGDLLHNLMGWGFLGVTALAVSGIATQLGATRGGSLLAGLLAIASPMALLEASNAKNDVAVGLWVAVFAYWTIRTVRAREFRVMDAVLLGGAASLALATKATGAVFLLPWCVFLVGGFFIRRSQGFPVLLSRLAIIGLFVTVVNAPHMARNWKMFGSVMGPSPEQGGYAVANERVDPGAITSNWLRNAAGFAALPSDTWNAGVFSFVDTMHRWMGVPLNDPELSYYHMKFTELKLHLNVDYLAVSPVHFWLLMAAMVLALRPVQRDDDWKWRVATILAVLGSFEVFCTWLKWQPWHPRLLVPLVLLAAAIIGAEFSVRRTGWLIPVTASIATLVALVVFTCPFRPLAGPKSVFFRDRFVLLCFNDAGVAESVGQACDLAASIRPRSVGFFSTGDNAFEYLYIRGMEKRLPGATPVFVHTNPFAMFGASRLPDVILLQEAVLEQLWQTNPERRPAFTTMGKFGEHVVLSANRR